MQVFTDEFIKLLSPELARRVRAASTAEVLQLVEQNWKIQQRSSVLRGIEGEGEVLDQLSKLQGFKVEAVGGNARSGDIVVSKLDSGLRMMIDVKNYTSNVPTREVDKFIRDIAYRNYDTAILLSLHTRITGYRPVEFDQMRTPQRTVNFAMLQTSSPAVLLEIVELMFAMCELRATTLGDKREWMVERFSDLEQIIRKIGETRQGLATAVQTLQNILSQSTESMIHIELDACRIIAELRSGIRAETYTPAPIDELDLKPYTHVIVQHTQDWKLSNDRKKLRCTAGARSIQIGLMKTTCDTIEIDGVDTTVAYRCVPNCIKWNYAPQSKTLSTVVDHDTLDALLGILDTGTGVNNVP